MKRTINSRLKKYFALLIAVLAFVNTVSLDAYADGNRDASTYVESEDLQKGYVICSPSSRLNNHISTYIAYDSVNAIANEGYVFWKWEVTEIDGDREQFLPAVGTCFYKASLNVPKLYYHLRQGESIVDYISCVRLKAYFLPISDASGVYVSAKPSQGGEVSGGKAGINAGATETVTIKAKPNEGYIFDGWTITEYVVSDQGASSIGEPYTSLNPEISLDCSYNQRFECVANFSEIDSAAGVTVRAEPSEGGIVSGGKQGITSETEEPVSISAEPVEGYAFDSWKIEYYEKDADGKFVYKSEYLLEDKNATINCSRNTKYECTAYFLNTTEDAGGVFVNATPPEGGVVSGGKEIITSDKPEIVSISAKPAEGFAFEKWEINLFNRGAKGGFDLTGTPERIYYVEDINTSLNCTVLERYVCNAIFKPLPETGAVTVSAAPPEGGIVSGGKQGITSVTPEPVSISAKSADGFVFDSWNVDYYVRNGDSFDISSYTFYDSSLTLNCTRDERYVCKAQFKPIAGAYGVYVAVDNSSPEAGTVTGSALYNNQGSEHQTTNIVAYPSNQDYIFDYWQLTIVDENGQTSTGANIYESSAVVEVPKKAKHTYTAIFKKKLDDNTLGVFTEVRSIDGNVPGNTSGDCVYQQSGPAIQQTAIQATPVSNDYKFSHWELSRDGVAQGRVSSSNPYTVNVINSRDVYTAVFIETPHNTPRPIEPDAHDQIKEGIDGGFYDPKRVFSELDFEFTKEKLAEMASQVLDRISGRYTLPSSDNSGTANALEEKLLDKDYSKTHSEMSELPGGILMNADGAEFTLRHLVTESYRAVAEEQVKKRFGPYYGCEMLSAVKLIAPTNCVESCTIVWRDSGANTGDNLLILQYTEDGNMTVAVPVADANSAISFTIKNASNSSLILLRTILVGEK